MTNFKHYCENCEEEISIDEAIDNDGLCDICIEDLKEECKWDSITVEEIEFYTKRSLL